VSPPHSMHARCSGDASSAAARVTLSGGHTSVTCTFDVYIAGLDATASDDDVAKVQTAIDLRTFGRNRSPKTCLVYKAPEVALDIAGIVYFSGAAEADVKIATEAALLAFTRSVPPGGFSFLPGPQNIVALNDIESTIRVAVQGIADPRVTVQLTTPAADTNVTSYGKVVRGDWTGLVYQQISV